MRSDIFEKILNEEVWDGINNLIRWNDSKRIKDETVAHHSFLVIWFTRILVEKTFPECENAHSIKLDAVTYALFHDFDEAYTGDILHPFKYNDFNGEEVRKVIKEFCVNEVERKFSDDGEISKMFKKYILADVPDYIKKIVKVSDWLAMMFYVRKEIKLGNGFLSDKYEKCLWKMRRSIEECIDILNDQFPAEAKIDLSLLHETKNSNFSL